MNSDVRTTTIREMSRLPAIAQLDESSAGWSFFLCARKELRTGRDGGEFLSIVLQDVSGQIDAKVFEDVTALDQEFEAGEFVKVHGHGNRHREKLELVLEKIRRVNAVQDRLDGFSEEHCIPSSPRPVDEMWQELLGRVARVENRWVRELLTRVLAAHGDRFRVWPAALTVHHAYRGGLLEHVVKLAEVGEVLARAYDADPDLLLTAAVLHDLGKLEELSYDGATSYSTRGNLIGHITLGVQMVRTAIEQIEGFPPRPADAHRAPDRLAPRCPGTRFPGRTDECRGVHLLSDGRPRCDPSPGTAARSGRSARRGLHLVSSPSRSGTA